jgi:predicted nucleotide-binding protein (sugar kinase/HSP70/actin superfamily)
METSYRELWKDRKLYVPAMTYSGAKLFAAAIRSIGIDASEFPPSDEDGMELASKYLSGEECFPLKVTAGDFLKTIRDTDFSKQRLGLFMPTAEGPCRFGQYAPFFRALMKSMKVSSDDVLILSPTSKNAYEDLGKNSSEFIRTGWRALVSADILRKLLLKTRPYEVNAGETERVYEECLKDVSCVLEVSGQKPKEKLTALVQAMARSRDRFRAILVRRDGQRPLIGVVGEIFCRLNRFSNQNLVKKIEEYGGEAWLSDVSEWVWYTNSEQRRKLRLNGSRFSTAMLGAKLKNHVQKADEHALYAPLHEDFHGYEEPHDTDAFLALAAPYLPQMGAYGEMVISVAKTIYLYKKGADGIIDISPFTCMNGTVTEAIYPRLSREHEHLPIKNFYFDGTQADLDRDVGIFIELARSYQRRKKIKRAA